MSAAVARGHGGDAGAKQKKKRGKSRSGNLDIAFEANGKKSLPIEFDVKEGTYKPVGKYASMFIRYLGNLIGYSASPHHRSWNEVSPGFKQSIIRRLRRWFILDPTVPDWPRILAGIERDCQERYKDKKSRLKSHFDRVGGYDNVENARRNPPSHLDAKKWNKAVDLFVDSKFKERSKKNAQNRSRAKYPSLHGSTSYVASRYKKKNPETHELQGSMDNWRDMHYSPTRGWVNDLARKDYEEMLAEQASQTQDGSTSSSTMNEKEIMTKVLGQWRGHNVGIGRKLKGSAFESFFEPPPPPPPMNDAYIALNQYVHQMYNAIRTFQPGFQFPPPPTIDMQPPQQPPQQDEDEDEDTDTDSYDDYIFTYFYV